MSINLEGQSDGMLRRIVRKWYSRDIHTTPGLYSRIAESILNARHARLRGDITLATQQESRVERLYANLPARARW